eukprot:TRINITY_DN16678_c0_g1_i1.p1 TRINITY_DN16678_c0_g1~~TRINITY_DN16678_c0_g1_i1.p1  ORF type:complete len:496 (+),score=213.95 TRINITY_DN16678_c0_g1_i1:142-1629(+)
MPSKKPNPLSKVSSNPLTKLKKKASQVTSKQAADAAAKQAAKAPPAAAAPVVPAAPSYVKGGELKKLELPAAPKARAVTEVGASTAIITPEYCRPREDAKATTRVRSGVPMVRAVADKLEREPDSCNDAFLQELVARRMASTAGHVVKVAAFPGREAFRMNMDESLATACKEMMERSDFTYGAMTCAKDVADSALHLPCLTSVETLEEGDFVSHAFCLVYQLFLSRTMRSKLQTLLRHDNLTVRAIALIYMRYVTPPAQLLRELQLTHVLNEDGPVVIKEEKGKDVTMPLSEFAQRLLLTTANNDFLDAMFPVYTAEEQAYLKRCLPLIKEHRACQLEYLKDHPLPPKEERDAARKKRQQEAAAEYAEDKRRYSAFSTMLHGFSDVGTQIGYVTYQACAATGQSVDALKAQQEEQRLYAEMENYARAQEAARAAEEARLAQPNAVDHIDIKKKAKKAPAKPAKRKAEEAPQDGEKKTGKKRKKTKLQKDADTYLF